MIRLTRTPMDPERFRKIEQLYHAALELDPGAGEGFIAEACGAELDLLREVESLLAHADWKVDRSLLQPTVTQLASGSHLGPYKMECRIGAGGMGQVFRALDTRLERPVAIK